MLVRAGDDREIAMLIDPSLPSVTQETCTEKFSAVLDGFPRLQDIHPFHADLYDTEVPAYSRQASGDANTRTGSTRCTVRTT